MTDAQYRDADEIGFSAAVAFVCGVGAVALYAVALLLKAVC